MNGHGLDWNTLVARVEELTEELPLRLELAIRFPMRSVAEIGKLANDIDNYGQHSPIWMWNNILLDGRARWIACKLLGREPLQLEWNGKGCPVEFAANSNMWTRRVSDGRRASIEAQLMRVRRWVYLERLLLDPAASSPVAYLDVYFIQSGENGPIKIGLSDNASERIRQLQTGSPVPLRLLVVIKGWNDLERHLHQKFKEHRIQGEWFHPAPELLALIEQLKARQEKTS